MDMTVDFLREFGGSAYPADFELRYALHRHDRHPDDRTLSVK